MLPPLLKTELELTCNIPFIVVSFDKVARPETLNADMNVSLFLNIEFELTFNIPLIVVLLYSVVKKHLMTK